MTGTLEGLKGVAKIPSGVYRHRRPKHKCLQVAPKPCREDETATNAGKTDAGEEREMEKKGIEES